MRQRLHQNGAEDSAIPRFEFLREVDHPHGGQRQVRRPQRQLDQAELPLAGGRVTLDRRRRAAHEQQPVFAPHAFASDGNGAVPRNHVLLVGRFVRLVDDDQANVAHGCEDGAARTDDHVDLVSATRLPGVEAFPL